MNKLGNVEAVRAEALQKLGRNVVNFQKIEGCLKYLLTVSSVEGTSKTIASQRRKKEKKVRKKSLGNLAEAFHRELFSNGAESVAPPDLSEIWASISIKIIGDADAAIQRKRTLASLVAERNKLIHQDLVRFDHNSVQSCRNLIQILDAQNVRLLQQLHELKLLIDTVKASVEELQSWIASNGFLHHLQVDLRDA